MLISKFNNEDIENAIQEIENRYGFIFPTEYRIFLQNSSLAHEGYES